MFNIPTGPTAACMYWKFSGKKLGPLGPLSDPPNCSANCCVQKLKSGGGPGGL